MEPSPLRDDLHELRSQSLLVRLVLELAPLLWQALSTGETTALSAFVDAHLKTCSSPYDGSELDIGWRNTLESGDLQEIADFALTKYYDPTSDCGLSTSWLALDGTLPSVARNALLGTFFGPSNEVLFDPGRMGSYFQSPDQVRISLSSLEPLEHAGTSEFVRFLNVVVAEGRGLYITF